VLITEKFDYEDIKKQMYRKGMKFKRVRSKVVKVLGKYYYKEMPEKEFYEKQSGFCKRIDNIHTEQELADYLAVE
jgi:hypothetical protein